MTEETAEALDAAFEAELARIYSNIVDSLVSGEAESDIRERFQAGYRLLLRGRELMKTWSREVTREGSNP